jgi:hypothetical protein
MSFGRQLRRKTLMPLHGIDGQLDGKSRRLVRTRAPRYIAAKSLKNSR